jgi:hypothetical protein
MAVAAGAAVVLAVGLVVATRPSGTGDRVVVAAGGGARAEVRIERVTDPAPEIFGYLRVAGLRNVVFTVRVRNIGGVWFGTRLDADAWAVDANGASYPANQMLSLVGAPEGSTDPVLNPAWQLSPGATVDRRLAFTVPRDTRLTRLYVVLRMGTSMPVVRLSL